MNLCSRSRKVAAAAIGLAALACGGGDATGPTDAPPLGRYSYSFDAGGITASGTMILTYATADSIAGHFDVPQYDGRFALGFRNGTAYLVYAYPNLGGTAIQRLTPTAGGLACGSASYFVDLGDSRPGTCATAYEGP